MSHSHKPKVTDWGFDEFQNWIPVLYGCTECDETFVQLPQEEAVEPHDHAEYIDGCFACKVPTLELGVGDAHSGKTMTGKTWDRELSDYRDARRQGIQPAGTTAKAIHEAVKASDNLGSAYNAETMAPAPVFTKKVAKSFKTAGISAG